MLGAVPETGGSFLRDFLYVDLGRTRSLLAQLYEGIPEKREVVEEKQRRWQAGVKNILGFGFDGGRQITNREQEQRALGDLHFAMLEDFAEAAGFLIDLSAEASHRKSWLDGSLHSLISDGQIIRISGPTQIINPTQFAAMFDKMDSIFGMSNAQPSAASEEEAAAQALMSILGGSGAEKKSDTADFTSAIRDLMYGPGIFVRTLPFGVEEPKLAVTGVLATPSEYLSEAESSAILSRFGSQARNWTLVGQVSQVPVRGEKPTIAAIEEAMKSVGERLFDEETQQLDRAAIEEIMNQFWRFMESMGLSESPAWPAITVIPLAVYRTVLPSGHAASSDASR